MERTVRYLLGADRIASCQRSCIPNPIGEDDPGVVSSAEGQRLRAVEDWLIFVSVSGYDAGHTKLVCAREAEDDRPTRKSRVIVSVKEDPMKAILVVLKAAHRCPLYKG